VERLKKWRRGPVQVIDSRTEDEDGLITKSDMMTTSDGKGRTHTHNKPTAAAAAATTTTTTTPTHPHTDILPSKRIQTQRLLS